MLDDLNELRTFQRIAVRGSLSAAARDLGVGPAVVSKRLAALERRAGQRLVHRTTRRLSLTEEGLALREHVERVLEALEAAELRLAGGHETPQGLLRVSAPVSFGRIHIAPLCARLAAQYPDLDVDLRLGDQLLDMIEARIDVAVRIGQPQDSSCVMRKLADNYRVVAAAPAYLDRRGRPQTPDDLIGHDLLRFDDPANPWRLEGPGGVVVDVEARPRLRADSGDCVRDWGLAGAGIMMKSLIDICGEIRAGRLERILPDWRSAPTPVYALTPSNRHMPPKARAFIDLLQDSLGAAWDTPLA